LAVSTAKSIVGIAPFVGPLLSELVGTFIPNQRIDRISKYVQELDERLSKFEKSYLQNEMQKEDCADLFEEGFRQATRSLSDERREYIASIIQHSLDEEHISYAESKHLLLILEELNDVEIIWLRSYLSALAGERGKFIEKHKDILKPIVVTGGTDQITRDKADLQQSYKNHLERLGLIQPNYEMARNTYVPESDSFTGKPKVLYYSISLLGKLLLRYIGLL
jgi:hypothetical protein